VDAVEMDVHLTADGEVVIYHDSKLKPEITRAADGRWLKEHGPAIRNLTLRQLKSYDVGRLKPGTGYAQRYPDQKPVDGERIPTLQEVVALAKKMGKKTVQFWIEIKTSPLEPELTSSPEAVADAVISIVRKAGVENRTVLLSFDWRSLAHARTVAPEIATAYLSQQSGRKDTIQVGRPGISPWTAGLDIDDFAGSVPRAVHAAHGHYWLPRYRDIDQKQLKEAHALGLKVIVWTPNKPDDMRRLIAMGVDGITTDRPDLLKELFSRTSLR
jgi:glycerophosphoryl diester phosphodiesterase